MLALLVVVAIVLVAAYVAARYAMARDRRAGERRQRALLDALDEGIVVWDADRHVTFANPSAERILGMPAGELEAANDSADWAMLRPDGTPMAEEERPTHRTRRTGEPCIGVELGLRRRDGTTRWLLTSAHPLRDSTQERGPHAVVVSFSDVTERRAAVEALERSNAELAQFAYVASHDLSEPLRMVTSYLQLLRRRYGGRLDPDADEFIDYAVDGAARMRGLIEDLLAYSRAGRETEAQPVDLGLVVAETLSLLASAIADARAAVQVDPLPVVAGDPGQLGQLLQNLVANALKFRDGRSARVRISAEAAEGDWCVSVADEGIGIDPRHHERVFKMFQRAHDQDAYAGTGIGLAICRKIVERHGGRLWAEPAEPRGTVFRFTVPAARAPAAAGAPSEAEDAAALA